MRIALVHGQARVFIIVFNQRAGSNTIKSRGESIFPLPISLKGKYRNAPGNQRALCRY
jgi:hypothetical protein